jgi:hypothetical protein
MIGSSHSTEIECVAAQIPNRKILRQKLFAAATTIGASEPIKCVAIKVQSMGGHLLFKLGLGNFISTRRDKEFPNIQHKLLEMINL